MMLAPRGDPSHHRARFKVTSHSLSACPLFSFTLLLSPITHYWRRAKLCQGYERLPKVTSARLKACFDWSFGFFYEVLWSQATAAVHINSQTGGALEDVSDPLLLHQGCFLTDNKKKTAMEISVNSESWRNSSATIESSPTMPYCG